MSEKRSQQTRLTSPVFQNRLNGSDREQINLLVALVADPLVVVDVGREMSYAVCSGNHGLAMVVLVDTGLARRWDGTKSGSDSGPSRLVLRLGSNA